MENTTHATIGKMPGIPQRAISRLVFKDFDGCEWFLFLCSVKN
jgi:hypothetical protein